MKEVVRSSFSDEQAWSTVMCPTVVPLNLLSHFSTREAVDTLAGDCVIERGRCDFDHVRPSFGINTTYVHRYGSSVEYYTRNTYVYVLEAELLPCTLLVPTYLLTL